MEFQLLSKLHIVNLPMKTHFIICYISLYPMPGVKTLLQYLLKLVWNVGMRNQFNEASGYPKEDKQSIQTNHAPPHPLNLGCTSMTLGSQIATHPGHGVKPPVFVWTLDTLGSTSLLNSGPTPIPQDLVALLSPEFPILMPLPFAQVLHSDTCNFSASFPSVSPSIGTSHHIMMLWPDSLSQTPFQASPGPYSCVSWFSSLPLVSLTYLPNQPTCGATGDTMGPTILSLPSEAPQTGKLWFIYWSSLFHLEKHTQNILLLKTSVKITLTLLMVNAPSFQLSYFF